jgi:multicomponent Na+:H+ antiporter subunit F
MTIVVQLVNVVLLIAFILAFIRLIKGPSLPDRVIALDLIAALIFGVIVTNSIANKDPIYLDVAIVLALIAFLGTIAYAKFVEKRVLK